MSDEKLREEREEDLLRRLLRLAGHPAAVSDTVALRVKQNVHAHWKQELRVAARKRILWILTGTIAACFLFTVVLWFSLVHMKLQPEAVAIVQRLTGRTLLHESDSRKSNFISARSIVFTNSILETEPDARVLLKILGGVTLRIDSSTRVQFKSDSIFVLERGMIDLDTGKTHRKITVSTLMGNVTDEGTRFRVRLNKDRIEISVHEGSVSLKQNGAAAHAIAAGDRLIANNKGEISVSKFHVVDSEWNTQLSADFNLEGRTLMEFLNWITRENDWVLKFSNAKIPRKQGQVVLHGSVATLSPDQMLAAVLPVCSLRYTLKDGVLTITESE